MEKEWMSFSRLSSKYRKGVRDFLNMAKANAGDREEILCPFVRCENRISQKFEVIEEHLVIMGMDPTYTT